MNTKHPASVVLSATLAVLLYSASDSIVQASERMKVEARVVVEAVSSENELTIRRGAKSLTAAVDPKLKVGWGTQMESLSFLAPGDLLQIHGWREENGKLMVEEIELLQRTPSTSSKWIGTVVGPDKEKSRFQLKAGNALREVDASQCLFTRNGEAGDFLDLREGDTVRVNGSVGTRGVVAAQVDIFPREPAAQQQISGRVTGIDYGARSFIVRNGEREVEVYPGSSVIVLRRGVAIAFEDLDEGDTVRITGVSPGSDIVVARFVQLG